MTQHHEKLLTRITVDPNVLLGKPVIRGTRLSVQYILELLSNGLTIEDLLDEYDGISRDDVFACLIYASETVDNSTFMPLEVEA